MSIFDLANFGTESLKLLEVFLLDGRLVIPGEDEILWFDKEWTLLFWGTYLGLARSSYFLLMTTVC